VTAQRKRDSGCGNKRDDQAMAGVLPANQVENAHHTPDAS
jgi:hypothetical protein